MSEPIQARKARNGVDRTLPGDFKLHALRSEGFVVVTDSSVTSYNLRAKPQNFFLTQVL
jgi:hypothetical protein